MTLIECVPNVSEGRRQPVIDALASRLQAAAGARLLDVSSDPSHHRSVFTLAGSPIGVQAAAEDLVELAIALIDLRTHTGVHPRLGAVDVVPFVPLVGATLADCADLARITADRIAGRFGIPVFLYEEAATSPARRRLSDIRRGGFEGLTHRLSTPEWQPDYGPSRPHPTAGAVVVGARRLLVAYNVNLDTDRLDVARAIAASVRESGGGLPSLRALGLALAHRGLAQVSMNLTDLDRVTIPAAWDAVSREASRHGVGIRDSEIVGLVPEAALAGVLPDRLKIAGFTPRQILEIRLREEGLT